MSDFGEELSRLVALARNHLKNINPKSPPADEDRRKKFHSIVMLIIHVSQIGRRDLQPTVSFLYQRAGVSTEEDCEKLRRLIRHVEEKIDDFLHLGASDLCVMINFIDAARGRMMISRAAWVLLQRWVMAP